MGACFGKRGKFSPTGSISIYYRSENLEKCHIKNCLSEVASDAKEIDDNKILLCSHAQTTFISSSPMSSPPEITLLNNKSLVLFSENDDAFQDGDFVNSSSDSLSNSIDSKQYLDLSTNYTDLDERSNWYKDNSAKSKSNPMMQHCLSKGRSRSHINLYSNLEYAEIETICNPNIGVVSPQNYFFEEKEQQMDSTHCQREIESSDNAFEIPFPYLNTNFIRLGLGGMKIGIPNVIEVQIGPSSNFSLFGNKLI